MVTILAKVLSGPLAGTHAFSPATRQETKRKLSLTSYTAPNFRLVKIIFSIIRIAGIEGVFYETGLQWQFGREDSWVPFTKGGLCAKPYSAVRDGIGSASLVNEHVLAKSRVLRRKHFD